MTTVPDIVDTIDHALDDWSTSADAMRWTPEAPTVRARPVVRLDLVEIARAFDAFGTAVRHLGETLNSNVSQWIVTLRRLLPPALDHDQHHPAPLCIDGHAYHQRQRNRRRRR